MEIENYELDHLAYFLDDCNNSDDYFISHTKPQLTTKYCFQYSFRLGFFGI